MIKLKKNDKINPNKEVISEAVPYLVIILVVIIIRTFIATPIKVNGPSMETTLYDGNLMILNKLGAKVNGLKRFDIVVVKTNKTYILEKVLLILMVNYILMKKQLKTNTLYLIWKILKK